MSKIEEIYAAQLAAQKERLKQDYTAADSDLTHQKQLNQKATDANLTRTAVEAQKAAVGNAELHNAYGLSSGARMQARVAQENQLQANMTALRATQQEADAEVERQRSILAQEYASAIRQAQSENDMAKAEALYQQAQQEQQALLERQKAAAQLMAQTGDYSRMAKLYGLSGKEVAALQTAYQASLNTGSGSSGNSGSSGGAAGATGKTMTYEQAKYLSTEYGQSSYLLDNLGIPFEQWQSVYGYTSKALAWKEAMDKQLAELRYRNNLSPENAAKYIRGSLNKANFTETEYYWLASQYGLI